MARRPISKNLQTRIFELRAAEMTIDQIETALSDDHDASRGPRPPARRTIGNYTRKYDELPATARLKDRPFEWHMMEELSIPWEASSTLLEIWSMVIGIRHLISSVWGLNPPLMKPTVREARWWWRVSHACPGLNWYDTHKIASAFVAREMAHDLLDAPWEVADLEALLAFKPWESALNRQLYYGSVEIGLIPPVLGQHSLSIPLVRQRTEGSWEVIVNTLVKVRWPVSSQPHLLPRQVLDCVRENSGEAAINIWDQITDFTNLASVEGSHPR